MTKKTLFFMLGIYICISLFASSSALTMDWCAQHGTKCSPYVLQPCCEETDECSLVNEYHVCVEKVMLGSHCKIDDDCHNIRYAECSSQNKCACTSSYIESSKLTCGIPLGQFCTKNYECATDNSICIDNKCQCSKRFIQGANNKCFQRMACDNDLTCTSAINYTMCYQNYGCACTFRYEAIGQSQCAPVLSTPCFGTKTCATEYSTCIDNVCQCMPNFLKRGSKCLAKYLGEPCQENADCDEIKFSACSRRKTCACLDSYVGINKTMCAPIIGGTCSVNGQCFINNSICIDFTCQCAPDYLISSEGQCVPVSSLKSCQVGADCKDYENSQCSINKKCVCHSNFAAIDEKSCVPRLGHYCTENYHCLVRNSECIDTKCQCRDDYSIIADNICALSSLGKSCRFNSDCDDTQNLICSEDDVCICNDNYTMYHYDRCQPVSNGFCLNDTQCTFTDFHCVDNKCQCKPNFTQVSAYQCLKSIFVSSCDYPIDCSDPWHASCINNKCICKPNHIAINNATCYPILGGLCWSQRQCTTKNSECNDYHCQCKDDFVALSQNFCAPKKLIRSPVDML